MSNIVKSKNVSSLDAIEDKHSGRPQFPIVEAIESLVPNISPAQAQRLVEQGQAIAALTWKHELSKRAKNELQAKINTSPDVVKLKQSKADMKKTTKAIQQAMDGYNGMMSVILTDFMPGEPLIKKIMVIEASMDQKQPKGRLLGN